MAKSNFKNTVTNFGRFLGLPSDYPPEYLTQEKKWLSSKIGVNAEGKLVHQVNYKGEDREFLPE